MVLVTTPLLSNNNIGSQLDHFALGGGGGGAAVNCSPSEYLCNMHTYSDTLAPMNEMRNQRRASDSSRYTRLLSPSLSTLTGFTGGHVN